MSQAMSGFKLPQLPKKVQSEHVSDEIAQLVSDFEALQRAKDALPDA